jgi:hypothetical protein
VHSRVITFGHVLASQGHGGLVSTVKGTAASEAYHAMHTEAAILFQDSAPRRSTARAELMSFPRRADKRESGVHTTPRIPTGNHHEATASPASYNPTLTTRTETVRVATEPPGTPFTVMAQADHGTARRLTSVTPHRMTDSGGDFSAALSQEAKPSHQLAGTRFSSVS